MEKGKLKRFITIAAVVLAVILISMTYLYVLNNTSQVVNGFNNILGILLPFIIGAVIAYLLKGTCNFFERLLLKLFSKWKKPSPKAKASLANGLAVFISYVVWIAAISVLLYIVISQVVNSVFTFINDLQSTYIDGFARICLDIINGNEFIADAIGEKTATELNELLALDPEQKLISIIEILSGNEMLSDGVSNLIQSDHFDATQLISQVFNGAVNVVSTTIDIVIGIIISVFLLLNRKILARKSTLLLHCLFKNDKVVNAIVEETKFADRMFGGFLEGKIIDSTIVGLIYYIVLELIGVPYAPLVAVICGVTNIIPIFGPFIGAIPSGLIILAKDPQMVIPFAIFVCICQIVDGYIIDPHIVGGNIKLPSVWVIFAVILFGGLWGFPGLLVGVPTFAVIYDICGKVGTYLLKKNGKYNLLVQLRKEESDRKIKSKKHRVKREATDDEDTDKLNADELNPNNIGVIAETVAESVVDSVADKVADSIVDAVSLSVAEAIAVAVAENIPTNIDATVADSVTETVTEKVADSVSEKVIEALSGNKTEASAETEEKDN